jgi:hypothetical protein
MDLVRAALARVDLIFVALRLLAARRAPAGLRADLVLRAAFGAVRVPSGDVVVAVGMWRGLLFLLA